MVKDLTPVIARASTYAQDLLGLHLGILIRPNGLGWSAHEPVSGRCLMLVHGEGDELPAADLLPERPASVSFTAVPELSTLVPESALVPGTEAAHLALVHGHLPTGLLRDEPIATLGARCVYLHDEAMEHRVLERFPAARSVALRNLLVRWALEQGKQRTTLVAHRVEKRFDVALADASGLRFSNAFHAATGTDALYYILFALDQLGLAPTTVHAQWAGPGWSAVDLDLLRRYLPLAAPVIQRGNKVLGDLEVETPEHWFALLEQAACAS